MGKALKQGEKPEILRYFFDTEFVDIRGGFSIEFFSIGIVPENEGEREYYGVSNEFNESAAIAENPWLKDNVIAKLPKMEDRVALAQIRQDILDYLKPASKVEFWAKNGSYDNFCLCKIFGSMNGMRAALKEIGIDKVSFRDLNEILPYSNKEVPKEPEETAHIAINDARMDRKIYKIIKTPDVY